MPKPKVVNSTYAKDLAYIVLYYLDTVDYYAYRSNKSMNYGAYYSLSLEEGGVHLPPFNTGMYTHNKKGRTNVEAFQVFLKSRKVFNYIRTELPEASPLDVASSIKQWTE